MSFRYLVRGIAGIISNVSHTHRNSGILVCPLNMNMSGTEETNEEIKGVGSKIGERGRDKSSTFHTEPFTLLLHILQSDGHPVPSTLFTAVNTADLV